MAPEEERPSEHTPVMLRRSFFLLVILSCGLRVKMCVWLGVSLGLDLAFLDAD